MSENEERDGDHVSGPETKPAEPAQHTDEQLDPVLVAFNQLAAAVAEEPVELVMGALLQCAGQLVANTSHDFDGLVANIGAVLHGIRTSTIAEWNVRLAEQGKAAVTLAQVKGLASDRALAELEANALAELILATASHRAPPVVLTGLSRAVASILQQVAPVRRRTPTDMLAEFVAIVRGRMGATGGVIVVPH
jgi:hypothetical protein